MNAHVAPVLSVTDLVTEFVSDDGVTRAVDGLNFTVGANETLAIVGESGCGKSMTSLSIMRLVPRPHGRISAGSISFQGTNLVDLSETSMRAIRGNRISMIFQEPLTALNPVLSIGHQLTEPLIIHKGLSASQARKRAVETLELVRISEATRRLSEYPHELSGGMRQRIMIAMALICDPTLLIADEPTTALDVTIQAQILTLMRELKDKMGAAIILITHDLGVVAGMAQRVIVMYAGRKVEEASVGDLFSRPLHPYTRGLLASVPRLGASIGATGRTRLAEIKGFVPALSGEQTGCTFAARCGIATPRCSVERPLIRDFGHGHLAACHEVVS